jgi:hypothetical protein
MTTPELNPASQSLPHEIPPTAEAAITPPERSRLSRRLEIVGGIVLASASLTLAIATGMNAPDTYEHWHDGRVDRIIIADNPSTSDIQEAINRDLAAQATVHETQAKRGAIKVGSFGIAALASSIGSGILFRHPRSKRNGPEGKAKAK